MTKIQITSKELKDIMKDYNFDIEENMDYDDDDIALFKAFSAISEGDRIILCLYSHFQSLRTVAKVLGVSYNTTRKCIAKIRNEIKEKINDVN